MKKWRIPRKIKKKIPKGRYCYGFVGPISWNAKIRYCKFNTDIKIKDVPTKDMPADWIEEHEEFVSEFGEHKTEFCSLFKFMLDDSCKGCGTKLKY